MSILATNAIIEFLRDESNRQALDGLRVVFRTNPQLDRDLVVRCTVLVQLGTVQMEPGAKMGLMVRFIELGLSVVDWDRVVQELELNTKLK